MTKRSAASIPTPATARSLRPRQPTSKSPAAQSSCPKKKLSWQKSLWRRSFQVSPDNLDQVVGGIFRGLCVSRHVIADVVFHQFGHQAVDGSLRCRQAMQDLGAGFVFVQRALHGLQLTDDLFGSIDQVEFFSGYMRHF